MAYYITNLKKLYNVVGDGIHNLLQDFECPLNGDVEYFFKHKSIEFSKQGLAETFVVFSSYKDENVIVGYFPLTNKTTKIKKDVLKGKTKKRMSRFAQFDDGGKYFYVSLPLIGQIGKKVLYVLENSCRNSRHPGDKLLYLFKIYSQKPFKKIYKVIHPRFFVCCITYRRSDANGEPRRRRCRFV